MRRQLIPIAAFAAFALLVAFHPRPVLAFDKGDDKSKLGEADRTFIRQGLQGTQVQASLARLARSRSNNENVKKFAEQSLGTLTEVERDLREQANKYDMDVSARANETQKDIDERLSKLKGTEFDEQYMKEQVGMLEWLVKVFDREIKEGDNDSLKSLATHRVDDLRDRHAKARKIYDDLYSDRKGKDK